MTAMLHRCALALLLPVLVLAQIPDLAVDRSTLPNGLDLLLHADRKAPVVHVNIRIRAGSKHELRGKFGIGHLTEHLFYQNRDGIPISTYLDRLGATNVCGDLNEDFTEYCETVPASRLERLLWLESNRFAQFLSENLTQKNLDSQREVVINERRLRVENGAYDRLGPVVHEQAFPAGHPYNHEVGGTSANLRSITLDDVRAFYSEHYTPNQMSIAIVGDFDPAEAKKWVAKYFGTLAPADVLASPLRSAPPLAAPKFVQLAERVREERIYFVWVGPPAASRDAAALEFAAFLLGDNYSSRNLHKVVGDSLSQGVSIGNDQFQDASLFYPYVTVAHGASTAALEEKIVAEFARLAREGFTAAEIASARNHLESGRLGDLESISSMASAILQVHDFYGGIDHWRDWAARYNSVTSDDIRAAINRWLIGHSHLTVDFLPVTATHPDTPEPDRTTPPLFQPEKPYRAPEIQSAKLPNGLQIFLLERHDLPKVSARLQFRIGALPTPPEKPAVWLLAATTVSKGKKTADGADFEQALSDLVAQGGISANLNAQELNLTILRKNFDAGFRIMIDGYLHPAYPEWAIEEKKKEWLKQIENPDTGLDDYGRELYSAAFGPNHPLGRGLGTADSIRSLTAADARDFHDRYWKPNIAALIFAGDITLKEAVVLATDTLGSWTGTAPPPPPMPPPAPQHGRIVFVDRKGVSQTMVVQVLPGVSETDHDYPALLLADIVYGRMSSSRIWENIRQQHGIAYYAHSSLDTLPGTGVWKIYSPVQQDSTALAMREFDKELAAFGRTKPITQDELDQARTLIIRSLPDQFETLGSATGSIAWNWALGLPLSQLQESYPRIAAITLDQVNAVARKYARPEQAFFLLVGDRAKIEPQLRDFR
jgi:zinc protease